jgi:hypothetical protein
VSGKVDKRDTQRERHTERERERERERETEREREREEQRTNRVGVARLKFAIFGVDIPIQMSICFGNRTIWK